MTEETEVVLHNVRLSFPHLFKPQTNENDDGEKTKSYSAGFLIDPDTKHGKKNIALMEDAIEAAKEKKWGERQPKLKSEKICLREGTDEDPDGYDGMMYVRANNSRRPKLLTRTKDQAQEEDGEFYAGCYVNAIVRVWAQDNKYGKRVNASLEAVQFFKHGEAFGAPPVDADAKFESYDDDDGDEKPVRKGRASKSKFEDDEDDEDDAPRRRGRGKPAAEDDEDEKPVRKRRAAAEDDEDEKPVRKRRAAAEDDEDDAPPRRRRAAADDDEDDDEDDAPPRRRRRG